MRQNVKSLLKGDDVTIMLEVCPSRATSNHGSSQEKYVSLYRRLSLTLDALEDLPLQNLPLDLCMLGFVLVDDISDLLEEISISLCHKEQERKIELWDVDSRVVTIMEEIEKLFSLEETLH